MMRTVRILALFVLLPARLEAQVILPLLVDGRRPVAHVHHAFEGQRAVWFATDEGIFYTSDGSTLAERTAKDNDSSHRELWYIARVDNELWVGGKGGVYRIGKGDHYERIDTNLPRELTVFSIIMIESANGKEELWLATSEGVFLRRTDGDFELKLPDESTFLGFADHGKTYAEEVDSQDQTLWASNRNGLFTFNRETSQFDEFTGHEITNVSKVLRDKNGQVYLWSNDGPDPDKSGETGTSLYEHPSGRRVGLGTTEPLDVEIVEGLLRYTVGQMIYIMGSTGNLRNELCGDNEKSIKTIEESEKYIWLIHRYGIFRLSKDENSRCRALATSTNDHEWNISSILETERTGLFFYGTGGVYRLRENIKIDLSIARQSFGLVNRYSVSDSGYYDAGDCASGASDCAKWSPPSGISRRFSAIITTSEEALEGKEKGPGNRFVPVGGWYNFGYHDVYYILFHDYYGNTRRIAGSMAVRVSSYPLGWLAAFVAYTLIPTIVVLLLFRSLPLSLRNLLYSLSSGILAPVLLRSPLLLMAKLMRRRLRDIYADSWLNTHCSSREVPFEMMRRIASSNEVFLEPEERIQVALNDIASEICRRSGKELLRDSIPLVYDLRDFEIRSSRDIRKEMNSHMKDSLRFFWLPFFGDGFVSKLIERGDFVFLFYYDGSDEKAKEAAREFARRDDSRRRLVMSAVPPEEGSASSQSEPEPGQGNGPDTQKAEAATAELSDPEPAPQPPTGPAKEE